MFLLALTTALAIPPTDLDGDGKPETVKITDTAVKVGKAVIPCETMDESCSVELHDVSSQDKFKEVAVCAAGVRDEVYCTMWRYDRGKAQELALPKDATTPNFTTTGSGIVLTKHWEDRIYDRITKYTLSGDKLIEVPQPSYYANVSIHVEATFPIYFGPDDERVVANVRPDSDIVLVLESAKHEDWYLVRISSGLMGWTKMSDLYNVCEQIRIIMSAG